MAGELVARWNTEHSCVSVKSTLVVRTATLQGWMENQQGNREGRRSSARIGRCLADRAEVRRRIVEKGEEKTQPD